VAQRPLSNALGEAPAELALLGRSGLRAAGAAMPLTRGAGPS